MVSRRDLAASFAACISVRLLAQDASGRPAGVVTVRTRDAGTFAGSEHQIESLNQVSPLRIARIPRLKRAIRNCSLKVTGPPEIQIRFHETCREPDLEKAIHSARTVRFCVPVSAEMPDLRMVCPNQIERLSSERATFLTYIHRGALTGATDGWRQLYEEAKRRGYRLSCENREVFVQHDMPDESALLTELQLGIEFS
jgi:hypothetical protein